MYKLGDKTAELRNLYPELAVSSLELYLSLGSLLLSIRGTFGGALISVSPKGILGLYGGSLSEIDHLVILEIDRRIILQWVMKRWNGWSHGLNWFASGSGTWRGLANALTL